MCTESPTRVISEYFVQRQESSSQIIWIFRKEKKIRFQPLDMTNECIRNYNPFANFPANFETKFVRFFRNIRVLLEV